MTPRTSHGLVTAVMALACETAPAVINEPAGTWITESAFEIGDELEGDALFTRVDHVQVSTDGQRVFVLEGGIERLTVWTPGGSLVQDVGGPGDGPGELMGAREIGLVQDGYYVRDSRRFTFFTHSGAVARTVSYPPPSVSFHGFRIEPRLLVDEGRFLGVPVVPAHVMAGWLGDDPIHELPVLGVSREGDRWGVDTLLFLDLRNRDLHVGPGDASFAWGVHSRQPYHDADERDFDPGTGTVVVLKKNREPGSIRLMELSSDGDTVWQQDLSRPVVPFSPEVLDDLVEWLVQGLVAQTRGSGSPLSRGDARKAVDEALYVPDFYPAGNVVRAMVSGDVWFETYEQSGVDTLETWFALRRGGNESGLRRILLPLDFSPHAATHTHVWGIRRDTLGINFVVGRRLVRHVPDRAGN